MFKLLSSEKQSLMSHLKSWRKRYKLKWRSTKAIDKQISAINQKNIGVLTNDELRNAIWRSFVALDVYCVRFMTLSRAKTIKLLQSGLKSVRNSLKTRVRNTVAAVIPNQTSIVSAGDLDFLRISESPLIARCPQGESWLYL